MSILSKTSAAALFLLFSTLSFAQNWPPVGGNNQHNGLSRMPGPTAANTTTLAWSVNSTHPTAWGNSVFIHGDRFVTTRIQLSPAYVGQLECRRLSDGALLWEKDLPGSILYAVGFDEHAVYVHDYATDEFYAFNPVDGALRWKYAETFLMFGGNAGVLFACNGDPVVFGKRLDKHTGDLVWENNYLIPIAPDGGFAAYGDTYYHWEGTVFTPKRLIAIDLNTGLLKYKSEPMAGDPDQENPLTIGPDGTIYITRDGGQLLAYRDTGTGIDSLWASDHAPQSRLATATDGSLYYFRAGRFFHVSGANGQILDSTAQAYASTSLPLIAVDGDGRVYATNGAFGGSGRYLCFTPDLQPLWSLSVPTNYYAGPAFGHDGTLVMIGEGTTLKAYRFTGDHAPVADFQADTTVVAAGTPMGFQDASSFGATSWQWFFPGATPASSTAQHPVGIHYAAPGIYDVTLVVSNALGADTLIKSCYLEVVESSPVVEVGAEDAVRIYPNPASEVMWLEAPPGSSIQAWNLAGEALSLPEDNFSRIDVSAWPAGFYLLEIKNGQRSWRQKVAVLH